MKKALFVFYFMILGIGTVSAQREFPSTIWHKGTIYGADGQNFSGLVKYDLENNLVQLQETTITTFTASNVTYFEIFDEIMGGVRKFYSLPYALNSGYETPIFFEILTEGIDIALLCREYIATDSRNMNFFGPMAMNPIWGPQNSVGYRLAFNFYFLKNGRIQKYNQKKKDLFKMLAGYDEEMDLFIRKNRLEHDQRGDLLRITAYYNQLTTN
jgi:hypothetical protein